MTLTPNQALMGLAGGVASALLFAAMFAGGPLATPLFAIFALPIAIAGLGWGTMAGVLAGVTAAVIVGLIATWPVGAAHVLLAGGPMAYYAHQVGLARPRDEGNADAGLEWFPLERVYATLVVLTAASLVLGFLLVGVTAEQTASTLADALMEMGMAGGELTEADRPAILELARIYLRLMPIFAGAFWVGVMTLDLWLGARVVRTSGRLQRPWEDLAATIGLAPVFAMAFGVAVVLAFFNGVIGLVAGAVAGAIGMGFVLQGLAVVHVVTRGHPARPFLLSATYVFLFLFAPTLAVLLVVGIADALRGIRKRRSQPTGPAR